MARRFWWPGAISAAALRASMRLGLCSTMDSARSSAAEIADIFRGNALKNGFLPIVVDEQTSHWLLQHPGAELDIDLEAMRLTLPTRRVDSLCPRALRAPLPVERAGRIRLLAQQAYRTSSASRRRAADAGKDRSARRRRHRRGGHRRSGARTRGGGGSIRSSLRIRAGALGRRRHRRDRRAAAGRPR